MGFTVWCQCVVTPCRGEINRARHSIFRWGSRASVSTRSRVWDVHPGEPIPRGAFAALDWSGKGEKWNVPTFGGKGYSDEKERNRRGRVRSGGGVVTKSTTCGGRHKVEHHSERYTRHLQPGIPSRPKAVLRGSTCYSAITLTAKIPLPWIVNPSSCEGGPQRPRRFHSHDNLISTSRITRAVRRLRCKYSRVHASNEASKHSSQGDGQGASINGGMASAIFHSPAAGIIP
ncbi:hypothetical protein V500_03591 [Pseudogymnoascus sp. VKM F-4518 (FW-2643)]|nr:hypothetical protein V500_03591 [Pseudogymnoascus sp. VKM F-4518 (FW-2643)]